MALERQPGREMLSVANDGEPIPADEINRIFTPYYRIPGHGSSGSGLGLAIVKEIAEQHNAQVSVHAKADRQGTVVTVSFPALLTAGPVMAMAG